MPAEVKESHHFNEFEKDYKITLPENWQVQRGFMGLDVFAAAPFENKEVGSRANISVISTEGDQELTLDQYFNLNIENLKSKLSDFKQIESGKAMLSGTEARKLVYSHQMNGLDIKVIQYFILKGKKGYVITCAASADVFPKYADTFERSVRTFQLL